MQEEVQALQSTFRVVQNSTLMRLNKYTAISEQLVEFKVLVK